MSCNCKKKAPTPPPAPNPSLIIFVEDGIVKSRPKPPDPIKTPEEQQKDVNNIVNKLNAIASVQA